jgi:hypothetical protein
METISDDATQFPTGLDMIFNFNPSVAERHAHPPVYSRKLLNTNGIRLWV